MKTIPLNPVNQLAVLNRIRRITRLMDTSLRLPVVGIRIGLDPILGLIPGGGDLISAAISAYIIYEARRFQLPPSLLSQMVTNVILESLVGSIPLAGDLFDVLFKANVRNLALLEKHLQIIEPEIQDADPFNLSSADPSDLKADVETVKNSALPR